MVLPTIKRPGSLRWLSHDLIWPGPHLAKESHSDAPGWLSVDFNIEEDLQNKYVRGRLLRVASSQARDACLG